MVRLHISRDAYTAFDLQHPLMVDGRPVKPAPACGKADTRGVIKRGTGEGLLHRNAYSSEFHCPECIQALEHKE